MKIQAQKVKNQGQELKLALSEEQEISQKLEKENQKKIQDLNNQLFLKEIEIDNLKHNQTQLEQKLSEINQNNLVQELEQLKNSLQTKLERENYEDLDDLLEAQMEFAKSNNSYAEKQLKKIKKKLIEKSNLTEQEIENICEIKSELAKLEIENKLEARVEVLGK